MSETDENSGAAAGRVRVWSGDITTLEVDAIVNAANETLRGGGGVDGAIHQAAGPELLRACLALPETEDDVRCPTGEARITPGFGLPARYVIHTVGPVWDGGWRGEPILLASCYRQSLRVAAEAGLCSVAFPAVSCGAYGYPIPEACRIAVETVVGALAGDDTVEEVTLVAWGVAVRSALDEALARATRTPPR